MIHLLHNDRSCKIIGFAACSILFFALSPASGAATPIVERQSNGTSSGGMHAQIWVPIVAVVAVLVVVGLMYWSRSSLKRGLARMGDAAATAMTTHGVQDSTPATREVTADQLAGRTSAPSNRRRSRRTRRTPSQISTTSLPLYMKEPGDQELVIFRSVVLPCQ
jgi:hypothetical protein